jgi:hypothetical protein
MPTEIDEVDRKKIKLEIEAGGPEKEKDKPPGTAGQAGRRAGRTSTTS